MNTYSKKTDSNKNNSSIKEDKFSYFQNTSLENYDNKKKLLLSKFNKENKLNILVIDDCEDKANDFIKVLKDSIPCNIEVAVSRNGGMCKIVKENKYDIVLLDNYLPLFDDSYELKACAKFMIYDLRKRGIDVFICSTSSNYNDDGHKEFEPCDFYITYNFSVWQEPAILDMLCQYLIRKGGYREDEIKSLLEQY